ncbi:transcription-repair coupling factor [Desulfovibrio sp.]|uniref:transcription-repair coupling factor n=1 Tax=Desulfovibrio sp. TaxID=885 RepID=UPI0023D16C16|nr:transcription-repair coupling factor [Desulfovibrio sp.]MDE7240762.1 transcription-repair coupling factor [Desulfovibrio sp.]
MQDFDAILASAENRIYLERSGMATRCRLACQALARGRTAVLAARGREELHEASALARLFLPELSVGDLDVGRPVWERPLVVLPRLRDFADRDAWSGRLAALYALAQGRPRCVVASMDSLIPRYMPRDFFSGRSLDLALGMDFSPELIIEQAVEWGYERVGMVTRPGELARRGDILDIYAPGYGRPVRLEFFGDSLEEMRLFDAESQRSLRNIEELTLLPASPLPLDPKGMAAARARCETLAREGRISENDAYTCRKALEEGGAGLLPGLLWEDASLFENWLDPASLWILPGEADSAEALRASRQSLKEELEREDAALPQPASLVLRRSSQPAPWNGFQCVFDEPLVVGVEARGVTLQERPLHQFAELFPAPGAQDRPWQHLAAGLKAWQRERRQVILSFSSERGRNKFLKLAEQDGIVPALRYAPGQGGLFALISPFRGGAELVWDNALILGEDILYPRAEKTHRSATRAFKGLDSFESLKEGDLLVHRDYGIGRFAGLHHLDLNAAANDFLLLEYAGHDKLYVPADRLGLIQRFKGAEGAEPALDRLGGAAWTAGKEKARKAIEKIAADLVEMYAYRKVAKGFRYEPPGELFREFEATFGYEETPDQARAIQDVLDDMDGERPMDRLVCGDVGFGKTEVALRAAFRAASEGRQVALLCPTTVLAEQHYQTFRARLSGFPVNVGLLSRFVPRARQKETLKAAEAGQIDILIGTHRLLSNDVKLPNLALLILDEEQRFGVRHKEKLKALKKNVDVLTLTATPIPRTLQLSMSGIRELSIIETAPQDRKPVASAVLGRDDATLRKVLRRELDREGQVFWVYNRVQGLERVAEYVRKLVPDARVGMAHGQMAEAELEDTMRKFWHGELDVLVCTSIVESGLDFPRANTLVVDQAQMFGLGQLYQLRGRVGRSDRQAYAFFVVPDASRLTETAEERLRVILDMDYLGAGFQVAMEDLRLRGAGNILGEVQSGHMSRVGLDLYLEMLEEAVARLKGTPAALAAETELTLGLPAHIPASYIDDGRERLRCYKALTSAVGGAAREEVALGIRDRFGAFPEEFSNFLAVLDFKEFLTELEVQKADIHRNSVRLVWAQGQTAVSPERVMALAAEDKRVKLHPPAGLSLPVSEEMPFSEALAAVRALLEKIRAPRIAPPAVSEAVPEAVADGANALPAAEGAA